MKFLALLAAALPAVSAAFSPALADWQVQDDGRVIQIPGLPPIAVPPGLRDHRDSGADIKRGLKSQGGGTDSNPPMNQMMPRGRPPQAASEPPPAPPAAPPPLPPEKRLADLYERLAKATDLNEAQGIAGAVERLWLFTASDTAGLIMTRALGAMQRQELPVALGLLDKLVTLEPQWAEAWNKRATLRFMTDDYGGSMEDISHVLALDPRHFGALMGMGSILQRSGNNKRALEAYRRVFSIYPALDSVKRVIDQLAPEVDGRDI